MNKVHIFVSVLFIAFFVSYFVDIHKQISLYKKEIMGYRQFFKQYKREQESAKVTALAPQAFLPEQLRHVPLADTQNIVLKTKKITIRNIAAPRSPSIIKHGNGYLLFFSYNNGINSSHIGCVELDKKFEQTDKEFIKINTLNNVSEDPRILQIGKETYLTYTKNDTNEPGDASSTTMNIASINLEHYKLNCTTGLELNFRLAEKNWVPFEYVNSRGNPSILLQYTFSPRKILELPNPKVNHLLHPVFSRNEIFQKTHWTREFTGWGPLEGGRPALKNGDTYLAFFYSSFPDKNGMLWNTLGAYTFENKPPFRLTAISQYPILFAGIYDPPNKSTEMNQRQTILPGGFVIEKEGKQELIHLSCGENNSTITIVTIDKECLLKQLKKISDTQALREQP